MSPIESATVNASGQRLLVVDDEPAICRFVRHVAEGLGYAVETVSISRDAIGATRRQRPDVIVLDLTMPEMDGIEVLRQLAADGCRARIVLTSGFDATYLKAAREIAELSGLSAIVTLPKPLRLASLRAAMTGEPA